MKERAFVMMAKLSGMSGIEIILKEMMPNLLPYLAISMASAVSGGGVGLAGSGEPGYRQPPRTDPGDDDLLGALLRMLSCAGSGG